MDFLLWECMKLMISLDLLVILEWQEYKISFIIIYIFLSMQKIYVPRNVN